MRFQLLTSAHLSTSRGPVVRLCGRDEDGRSVVLSFHDQLPFFYVRATDKVAVGTAAQAFEAGVLLQNGINSALNERLRHPEHHTSSDHATTDRSGRRLSWNHVVEATWMFAHDFYGFSSTAKNYLRLTFASVEAAQRARSILTKPLGDAKFTASLPLRTLEAWFANNDADSGILRTACTGTTDPLPRSRYQFVLAEANIAFDHQLIERLSLSHGAWVDVDLAKTHRDVIAMAATHRLVAGQMGTRAGALECVTPASLSRIADVRVCAFDLETYCKPVGDAMRFFDGDEAEAKLLCVSTAAWIVGKSNIQITVFALDDVDEVTTEKATNGVDDVEVRWFTDERNLIRAFFGYLVSEFDADIITGWNTERFDWAWLIKRCAALNVSLDCLARFGSVTVDTSERAWQLVSIPGRIVHDLMLWFKRNRSLREYSLQYVATENQLDGKDDVAYSDIHQLFHDRTGRVKLAVYCALDSTLVIRLMQRKSLDPLGKTLAISQLTGVPPEDQLYRGSMNTLRLAMLRAAHKDGFVLSCPSHVDAEPEFIATNDDDAGEARYQGAVLIQAFRFC